MKKISVILIVLWGFLLPLMGYAGSLTSGSKTVTTAGNPVRVAAQSTRVYWVEIQAKCGNTGNIFVGDSTVSSTVGTTLTPCTSLQMKPNPGDRSVIDLYNVWLDSAVNGEGVLINYWPWP